MAPTQAAGSSLVPQGSGRSCPGTPRLSRRRRRTGDYPSRERRSTVTLVGTPSELMLYAHGRTSVAEIKLVGEPDAIEILNSSDLRT